MTLAYRDAAWKVFQKVVMLDDGQHEDGQAGEGGQGQPGRNTARGAVGARGERAAAHQGSLQARPADRPSVRGSTRNPMAGGRSRFFSRPIVSSTFQR